MALKVGTESKRNVIIAGVLFAVVAYLGIRQLVGGPSTPASTPAPTPAAAGRPASTRTGTGTGKVTTVKRTGGMKTGGTGNGAASGTAARRLTGSGLDPSLHFERLALSETIGYEGSGRNIFSGEAAPTPIEVAAASARPGGVVPVNAGPPSKPQPPAIDLKFFGYSASKDGRREAFLLHGDDIFEAAAGEIVNQRFKVVSVDPHSVQVTDLSYNNTQTLQLMAN